MDGQTHPMSICECAIGLTVIGALQNAAVTVFTITVTDDDYDVYVDVCVSLGLCLR